MFGFSKVIKTISESKKLVVGHNMVLDICHTLNQFCAPLPVDYVDFKDMTATVFPNILDTKLMANTIPFKDEIFNSSLNELYRTVSEKPYEMLKILPRKEGYGYSDTEEKYHEAGFDAYTTGLCLISMHKRMSKLCGTTVTSVDANSAVLKPFLNKLYLMKVADIPYMNLGAADMYPDRDHVFHLEIPKEWKTQDIIYLFSNISFVQVFWINDTSVFVALREKAFANTVLPTLGSNMTFKISTYKEHFERQEALKSSRTTINPQPAIKTPNQSPFRVDRRDLHTTGLKAKQLNPSAAVNQTGITPVLEKTFEDGITAAGKKKGAGGTAGHKAAGSEKRPVSPNAKQKGIKRSKSIVEEKEPAFKEPEWE